MRDCVARDVNEVFDIAMRLSTAFSLSTFGTDTTSPDKEAQRAFDEWADKVREQVLSLERKKSLTSAFNVSIPLGPRKRLRVGFVHGGYVAQFGVLRVGRSMTSDQRALKLKMFDLEALRREQPFAVQRAELIVGVESPGDSHPTRQRETLAETWDFITHEATARGISPRRCVSARDASEHVARMAG